MEWLRIYRHNLQVFLLECGYAKYALLFFELQVTTDKTLVRRYHNTLFMKSFFMYALSIRSHIAD